MKRFLITIALTCALSSSAFAGLIPSVGAPAPASNGTSETTTSTSPGDIPSGGKAEELSSDALSALLAVLSFLAV